MLDRLTGKPVHLYIHLIACCLIAGGLPASKIPLSLGTMLLALNLILKADFRNYGKQLAANKLAWGLWTFLLIYLLSLFWTSDFTYGADDLRKKLTLIIIPLALIAYPLPAGYMRKLIPGFFLASLFVTSFINVGSYQHWWGNKLYDDFRGMSLFASHIRYSLMIVFGFALCASWFLSGMKYRYLAVIPGTWFLWYANYSQVLSGYLVAGGVGIDLVLWLLRSIQNRRLRFLLLGTAASGAIVVIVFVVNVLKPVPHKTTLENLPWYTVNGNPYRHTIKTQTWENGYPVVAYISDVELASGWKKVSDIDYYTGLDLKKQPIYYTLWVYMTSKGLHKDSLGFLKMTKKDIENVEKGYTSVLLTGKGLKVRLYGIKHQLEHSRDPNGHSLLQRIEYWKAGRHLIAENWLIGTGMGDVDNAFKNYYYKTKSPLQPELRVRAHNQFMTSWISAGILCFAAFLFWWFGFAAAMWKHRCLPGCCFAAIAILSFLVEDTLETQVGITFCAFFYAFYVTGGRENTSTLSENH